jgi:hypothetical protein
LETISWIDGVKYFDRRSSVLEAFVPYKRFALAQGIISEGFL